MTIYLLGTRMRKVKEIRDKVLSGPGRYRDVRPEGAGSNDPASLKVKEVVVNDTRYIVCLNPAQARKEANDRNHIVSALSAQLKKGAKSLVGNKGYRRYLSGCKSKQDLKVLQRVEIEENGRRFPVRTQCQGNCGKIFQAVGVAMPPPICEV